MNKFIKGILGFSLRNKFFILFMTALIVAGGIFAYLNTPIEAFPDVTNTQIRIITQWPGRSAEEVEKLISIPIEIEMNSVQKRVSLRSISLFGLSVVTIIFDDDVDDFFARQQVANRLMNVNLPEGIEPEMEPPYGPTGEIFRYTLSSPKRTARDLKTLQDWVIERQIKSVPGIADVVSFGGSVKTYEVSVDPHMLTKYNITSVDVYQALANSNINVGGDVVAKGTQAYVVRGIGLLNDTKDIENVIVTNIKGTPILIKNLASVSESELPRLGKVGRDNQTDLVEGIVVMRKGGNASEVLEALKAKIDELNTTILPADVKIVTFYDRSTLIDYCIHTVLHNLTEGIILVTLIVLLFMADWRTTLIVSLVIPLALLFAFICMRIKGMSANLLSMGAIDFGIIIDGAVVMVEGIFVALDEKAHELGMPTFNKISKLGLIRRKGTEMGKSIFFAKLIIITALIPIFAFQKVEGKMFSPLAYTLGFALLGALIFSLTLVPVLSSILLNRNVREKHNPIVSGMIKYYSKFFDFTYKRKKRSLIAAVMLLAVGLFAFTFVGSEFLPHLDEGAIYVRASFPMSISLPESAKYTQDIRNIFRSFPEVRGVISQTGRPNDGTDATGFFNNEFHVDLFPKEDWPDHISKDELIEHMRQKLDKYPGVNFNFSQPISDNVEEAVSGVKGSMVVKIFGPDLRFLETVADSVKNVMAGVRGVEDLGVFKNIGQPELRIELDQQKLAFYGITTAQAQAVVEMAIGGKAATQLYEGERKFDIRIRYMPQFRQTEEQIGALMVPTNSGSLIPLKEISTIREITGPAFIYRDNNLRFIAIKFSIGDRDMGSTIKEAQQKVQSSIHMPKGYQLAWSGEFENQVRAQKRLSTVVPISLLLIFLILFITFGNVLDAGLVLVNVPFALIGGIGALLITHTNFSISAGIGFIALFGVCIQNGVILISEFKQNLLHKQSLDQAIRNGVLARVRPVVMTALMAMIGLLPAAISTGIGSETQRPLARVVIGGLITATVLVLVILPIIYSIIYERKHRRMEIKAERARRSKQNPSMG